jgi:hypothetical protein
MVLYAASKLTSTLSNANYAWRGTVENINLRKSKTPKGISA